MEKSCFPTLKMRPTDDDAATARFYRTLQDAQRQRGEEMSYETETRNHQHAPTAEEERRLLAAGKIAFYESLVHPAMLAHDDPRCVVILAQSVQGGKEQRSGLPRVSCIRFYHYY
jgi:hypothetical protein